MLHCISNTTCLILVVTILFTICVDIRRHLNTYIGFRKDPLSLGKGRILGFHKRVHEVLCTIKGRVLLTDAQLFLATFGPQCIELLMGYIK
jgi:hypothetical protein